MLDTNTASYAIKGNAAVRKHLLRTAMQQVCISVVTEAELLFGTARRPDNAGLRTAVQEFLLRIGILSWDSEAAHQYAYLRALLERRGKAIGNMDLLIAAHALAANLTLVTNDQVFHQVSGLTIVNWSRR